MVVEEFTGGLTQTLVLDPLPSEWSAAVGRDTRLDFFLPLIASDNEFHHLTIRLTGPGASARVNGVFLGSGDDALNIVLDLIHEAPDTSSRTNFRAVLTGQAQLDFRGLIKIEPPAQRADGFLEQRSLVISPAARVTSVPALEIEADDVKASHAVTSGPNDPEQLFYILTRGLSESQARKMLINGFIQEVVGKFSVPLQETVLKKLDMMKI